MDFWGLIDILSNDLLRIAVKILQMTFFTQKLFQVYQKILSIFDKVRNFVYSDGEILFGSRLLS